MIRNIKLIIRRKIKNMPSLSELKDFQNMWTGMIEAHVFCSETVQVRHFWKILEICPETWYAAAITDWKFAIFTFGEDLMTMA